MGSSLKDPPMSICLDPLAFVWKCAQVPSKRFEWIGATPSSHPHYLLLLGGPGSIWNRKRVIGCRAKLLSPG